MGWAHAPLARFGLLMIGAAASGQEAMAGAWTQDHGKSQSITTLSQDSGDFGKKWRADSWLEYGLGGGWAFNLKAETEMPSAESVEDRTGYRVGLQKSFALGGRGAIGVSASWLAGDAVDGPLCEGEGYEGRAMVGASYDLMGRPAFVNAEAGWKTRGGDCERALVEVSAGVDVTSKWKAVAKVWGEEGRGGSRSAKAEASFIRDFGAYSLGLGYREEISGDFTERGVLVSLWTKG